MDDAVPLALVVHAIPNRTRLRIPSRRGDPVFFASIATALAAMPGIRRVAVQSVTGSVLLEHGKPATKLLEEIADAGLFRVSELRRQTQPLQPVAFDPKIAVGVGMGVFALWQLTKGRVLPPAITLGWYAAALTGLLAVHDAPDSSD